MDILEEYNRQRKHQCKGPGVGMYLLCSRNNKEAHVTGVKRDEGSMGDEVIEVEAPNYDGFVSHSKDWLLF